ncbi:MAG: DUF1704 domain-containing protein [Candidatus Marinimicrobia bacterium]|nr:DUF1704 domain-containing protein [Candidatus Neomarinimicrobiota bacterium]
MVVKNEADRIRHINDLLYRATRPIRILSHVSWSSDVRKQFFNRGAQELPVVSYPPFNVAEPLEIISEARRFIKDSSVDVWLSRQANYIENSARMLAACGTPDYFKYSRDLYGTPLDVLPDQISTSHALATRFDEQIESFTHIDLGAPPPACYLAGTVAEEMEAAVKTMFNEEAPEILIVDELSANALAGPKRIRIRRTASFTDKDINQLIHHEAYVHVATSLNGLAQSDLKLLAAGHPGTTKTQEGLAVFAEFITGSIDLDRMHRLADRVLAIQMAIDGADFLDVYRYFLDRTGNEGQAFENARRVFRGGMVSGGAPFTKDIVYLDGLLRVHNFLLAIVSAGRADCLRLLFCGKLDIEDIPILYELSERGLCRPPKYLPPWANDIRFLLCFLSYSSFLNNIDLGHIRAHYDELLEVIPKR